MPIFGCGDCAELHALGRKTGGYIGFGTCGCACPLCGNEGRTLCETCGGKGKTGVFGRVCKTCDGKRTLLCAVCRGYLAHPNCPVCKGSSCETCFGSRRVDLEAVLARLKPVPRRRILLQPARSPRLNCSGKFPIFTFERAYNQLAGVVDPDCLLSVRREDGFECVHLFGKLIDNDRSDHWIYRIAGDQYGLEQRVLERYQWQD